MPLPSPTFAVVPVLVGPLSVLMAMLPAILAAFGAAIVGVVLAMFQPAALKKGARALWRLKFHLVVVAAVLYGVRVGIKAAWPESSGPGVVVEDGATDWPAFRGGPTRTGAVAGSPDGGPVVWTCAADAMEMIYSSPAIVGNLIYVTSASNIDDRIHCLNADTGELLWKSKESIGLRATFSSPAIFGKYLVSGEGLHDTYDARVLCLDISPEGRGKLLWSYRTRNHVESTAAIADGRVYIGAGDDGYYCFKLEPDADGEAQIVWHAKGPASADIGPDEAVYADCETSPVVHEGRVYVGLGLDQELPDGTPVPGKSILCLDAETGAEIWRAEMPCPVFGPGTIADGRVFFGMGNGDFVNTAADLGLPTIGRVVGVDLADPSQRVEFGVGDTVLGAIAARDGRLYFGSRDGHVYCISTDGKELARRNVNEPLVTSPAVTDKYVYVVTGSGRLHVLDAETLDTVWETSLAAGGNFFSSPTIARGHIYAGSEGSGLICLGEPDMVDRRPIWSGPGVPGTVDGSPLPELGEYYGRYSLKKGGKVVAPAAALGDRILTPVSGGPQKGLVCIPDEPTDKKFAKPVWTFSLPGGVVTSPAMTRELAFCIGGVSEGGTRYLHCLDMATGAENWKAPVGDRATGALLLMKDAVYVECVSAGPPLPEIEIAAFDLQGNQLWRVQGCGPLSAEGAILMAGGMCIDRSTGTPLKDFSDWARYASFGDEGKIGRMWCPCQDPVLGVMPSCVCGTPILYDGTIYAVVNDCTVDLCFGVNSGQIAALKLGAPEGTKALAGPFEDKFLVHVRPAFSARHIAYVTRGYGSSKKSSVVVLDRATLNPLQIGTDGPMARATGALPTIPPLLLRDAMLYATADGIMRMDLQTFETSLWLELDADMFGPVTTPMILVNSRLYFSTEKRGFIRAGQVTP